MSEALLHGGLFLQTGMTFLCKLGILSFFGHFFLGLRELILVFRAVDERYEREGPDAVEAICTGLN